MLIQETVQQTCTAVDGHQVRQPITHAYTCMINMSDTEKCSFSLPELPLTSACMF